MHQESFKEKVFESLRGSLESPKNQTKISRRADDPLGTTSWVSVFEEKTSFKLYYNFKAPCLSFLNTGYYPGVTNKIHNILGLGIFHEQRDNSEASLEYLSWIISPTESPWRDIIRSQPHQEVQQVYESGYALVELDFSANWVVNFLTAFRWSFEKPEETELWLRLHKAGVSKCTSYLIASSTKIERGDCFYVATLFNWHSALNIRCMDYESISRMRDCKPNPKHFRGNLFSQSTENIPVNCVWYPDGQPKEGYPGSDMPDTNLYKDFKRIFEAGRVSKFGGSLREATFDDLVEFGKQCDLKSEGVNKING